MPLLLIGDEQENMVRKYLDRGELFVLERDGAECALCVVTDEGDGVLEIKNIAVYPEFQRRGCGRELISFLEENFRRRFCRITAGTGDSPLTIPFYEKCGFVRIGTIENFFTDNYDHPIVECGVALKDMILFAKEI